MTDLAYVLRQLPLPQDPNLLVGTNPADDAAVYKLRDDLALIQTVDFFTPIVDDPYTFGQIAAANSLSDVYAMGGTPLSALNIAAFPATTLSMEILAAILQGGADKAAEAGISIVGGHTVDDDEPKYGLSVIGTVHPNHVMTAHGAKVGDRLVLTKPLGTGTLTTAVKAGKLSVGFLNQAIRWMTTLNQRASQAMMKVGVHAATDITGFGLLGHLADMSSASGVASRISASSVPVIPGALEAIRGGYIPRGARTNLSHLANTVMFSNGVDDVARLVLVDPQTSGGLLIACPADKLDKFRSLVGPAVLCTVIGDIVEGEAGRVSVEP